MSRPVTPTSAALQELVLTLEATTKLYDQVRHREPTDQEDRRLTQLEDRAAALEAQIKRDVQELLGVDYGVLYAAVSG